MFFSVCLFELIHMYRDLQQGRREKFESKPDRGGPRRMIPSVLNTFNNVVSITEFNNEVTV